MPRSRSSTPSLSRLLHDLESPIYVLDAERRIVFVNAALENWLNVTGEEIIGTRCDYHALASADRVSDIAGLLCPPPAAFFGDRPSFMVPSNVDGAVTSVRQARCLPLLRHSGPCEGVVVVVDAGDLSPETDETESPTAIHARLQSLSREAAGRYRLERLIGDSPAMERVRRQVLMAMHAQSRTVIVGPRGSGREHVARTMHLAGGETTEAPLMPLACALVDAEMLQTSITTFARRCRSAPSPRMGALLLLDVDQLNAASQAELAGFLAIPGFDLHTLATARTCLLELAQRGEFRHDLALALSTLVVELPPLSSRKEDIPLLVQSLIEALNAAGGRQIGGATSAALDLLSVYDWPGNIDELAEVVRFAHAEAQGVEIAPDDLPEALRLTADIHNVPRPADPPIQLDEILAKVEDALIQRALLRAKGNKTKAAEFLGITRARLHRKLGEDPATTGEG
jgi:DNA-binding NtrC family response regulator